MSNPRAEALLNEWREYGQESSYVDWLEDRAIELEDENQRLREAMEQAEKLLKKNERGVALARLQSALNKGVGDED